MCLPQPRTPCRVPRPADPGMMITRRHIGSSGPRRAYRTGGAERMRAEVSFDRNEGIRGGSTSALGDRSRYWDENAERQCSR